MDDSRASGESRPSIETDSDNSASAQLPAEPSPRSLPSRWRASGPRPAASRSSSVCSPILPVDTGIAIVFIQHLDSKHHSMLAEILGRATSMAVSRGG